MSNNKLPGKPSIEPVLYVHAKGRGQVDKNTAKALLELGLPVCSRLAHDGLTQTENGYDRPALLIAELAGLFPGRAVIFLRAGLQLTRPLVDRLMGLLDHADQPAALTVLSNADGRVNPFSGLQAPAGGLKCDPGDLVNLLAPGQWHSLNTWTDHFMLLSAGLVSLLASGGDDRDLMHRLQAAGGTLLVPDPFFLHDPESKLFTPIKLQAHETACPPPFSELSARLQQWFNAGITDLPEMPADGIPATLHITHSWGGGVAQWLNSFIASDAHRRNFQLRSEHPQSGLGFGQKISLYAGNELRCPIASWWLSPAIASITDSDRGYREILAEICQRYGIGRVFVSSLVGHSLEALRTGKPTLQVLHDHFPLWPLLSVNPQPYLHDGAAANLELALQEHAKILEFHDKDALDWSGIRDAYVRTLGEYKVKIAAPGQSVLDLQCRLEPAFATLAAEVIPHAFPVIENLHPIEPKPRNDGRLRLLVLGRMQTGKGQQLLRQALAALTTHVQVYLVGTGKSGEAFFGLSGVDVILDYKRDELPAILAEIGPDFAALLSLVPETFSFTLSELQQMQIPVIATRVGSFPGRIEHGKTGWLVDPEPEALVNQVASSVQIAGTDRNRACEFAGHQRQYAGKNAPGLRQIMPCIARKPSVDDRQRRGLHQTQQAAAEYRYSMADTRLQKAIDHQAELEKEVDRRTDWALETGRQLKFEQKRREEWVELLNSEISQAAAHRWRPTGTTRRQGSTPGTPQVR